MSLKQNLSDQIRELRQTDSILWMIGLGHTFTHWCPATFYLLLPFLVKEMGLTYSQAGFLVTIRAGANLLVMAIREEGKVSAALVQEPA